jgi:hypothetical protein
VDSLLKDVLDLLVWCFNLTTCLGVIWSGNSVLLELSSIFWSFYQWTVVPHRWWLPLVVRISGILYRETFSSSFERLLYDRVLLLPIFTHNPLPLVSIHNSLTSEKVPCSRSPRHRRFQHDGWWWGAWHLFYWCYHASDNLGTFSQNPWHLGTLWAKRNHIAKLLHWYGMLHNVLHILMSDTFLRCCSLPMMVRNA